MFLSQWLRSSKRVRTSNPAARRKKNERRRSCLATKPTFDHLETRLAPAVLDGPIPGPVVDQGLYYLANGQRIDLQPVPGEYVVQVDGKASSGALERLTGKGGALPGFTVGTRVTTDTYLVTGSNAVNAGLQAASIPPQVAGATQEQGPVVSVPDDIAWMTQAFTVADTGSKVLVLNEAVVALKPGVKPAEVFGKEVRGYRPLLGTPDQFVVTLPKGGQATLTYANSLAADSRVSWASPNLYVSAQKLFTPNDPLFSSQWHLNNTGSNSGISGALAGADVKAPAAWDISTGNGVTIAVVDSGIQLNHPDLAANIFVNSGEIPGNGLDDDGNGYVDDVNGWSFLTNSPNPTQSFDDIHGTAVAGIAAGRGDNGLGIAGAAFNARILPVQIMGGGGYGVSFSGLASAIYYAAGRTANGLGTWSAAQVINCSWKTSTPATVLTDAFTWASNSARGGKGVATFVASGNDYSSSVSYPANLSGTLSGVMAVGASNDKDVRSGYSNYGTQLDFVAPSSDWNRNTPDGKESLATTTTDRTGADGYNTAASPNGDYTTNRNYNAPGSVGPGFGGTSSASPLAAGVGALLLSANPNLTAAQVKQILRATADKVGGVTYDANGFNSQYGYGRINALAALRAVRNAYGYAVGFGGANDDSGIDVAVDRQGNVYTTGYFSGTADFDPGIGKTYLTSRGSVDAYVMKLDSAGAFVWAKQLGSTDSAYGRSVAVDVAGNVYVTGDFYGMANYGLVSAGGYDAFVLKLDKDGNPGWAKALGGGNTDEGLGVTVDAAGNVYATGDFWGTVNFDHGSGGNTRVSAGSQDAFVVKMSSTGTVLWAKSMGGPSEDYGRDVAVAMDGTGNVYVSGDFSGTAMFGSNTLISAGGLDGFVTKLDSSGGFTWAKPLGGAGVDRAAGVTVDRAGNVAVAGFFSGTVVFNRDLGTSIYSSAGDYDAFVVKLDSNGAVAWARNLGGTRADEAKSIAADSVGNLAVAGYFHTSADFVSTKSVLTSAGGYDAFVVKLDGNGSLLKAGSRGGTDDDLANGVTVDGAGNIYATGRFSGTADFDPDPASRYDLVSAGKADVFVVKVVNSGTMMLMGAGGPGTGAPPGSSGGGATLSTSLVTGSTTLAGVVATAGTGSSGQAAPAQLSPALVDAAFAPTQVGLAAAAPTKSSGLTTEGMLLAYVPSKGRAASGISNGLDDGTSPWWAPGI